MCTVGEIVAATHDLLTSQQGRKDGQGNIHRNSRAARGRRRQLARVTSKSCSVVAVIIADVAYATSCSIPGCTDEKKLEGEKAFDVFAILSP